MAHSFVFAQRSFGPIQMLSHFAGHALLFSDFPNLSPFKEDFSSSLTLSYSWSLASSSCRQPVFII